MAERRVLAACAAVLVLAACSTPAPMRLHTLMPVDLPPAAAAPLLAIDVLPVGVPAALDQQPLLLRDAGGGALTLLERERWAAPLGEELRAALAASLVRALGARDVSGLMPRPADALRIKVELRRFESVPGAFALIEADWSLARGDAPARLICGSTQRVAAGAGVDALVHAHRQALAALAAQIAAAARGWPVGAPVPACPASAGSA
jgi:uncharacterized lipoprotein YmbA